MSTKLNVNLDLSNKNNFDNIHNNNNNIRQKPLVEKTASAYWGKYGQVDRSDWWKSNIKPYPGPGLYSQQTFLDILSANPVRPTYGFLSDGRKKSASRTRKGEYLLPGAYEYHDFGFLIKKKPSSYSFNVAPRRSKDLLRGVTDINLDLAPGQYDNHQYFSLHCDKGSDKMMAFRSKSKRFPSKQFEPKIGPAPCDYDVVNHIPITTVTSSFKSQSARFKSSHNKFPGPGTYDKSYESPPPPELKNLGRQHGLFFNSTFCN